MIQLRRLFVLILFIICVSIITNADDNKNYKCEGTTYSSTGRVNNSFTPIITGFTWVDSKGISYPIFMSNSGSCFIIKHRKSDNKEYRDYLGKEISIEICRKLGKEYKGKKK